MILLKKKEHKSRICLLLAYLYFLCVCVCVCVCLCVGVLYVYVLLLPLDNKHTIAASSGTHTVEYSIVVLKNKCIIIMSMIQGMKTYSVLLYT